MALPFIDDGGAGHGNTQARRRGVSQCGGHRHRRIEASQADIVKALTGNWREEHLFVLEQALALYDDIGRHLAECDAKLDALLDARAARLAPSTTSASARPTAPGRH